MSIYCLSSLGLVESCHYKIGKTTKTQIELENQYLRYLPSVKTYRFEKVEDANKVEKQIHTLLAKYRVGTSEWFKCDLQVITKTINSLISPKVVDINLEKQKLEIEKERLAIERQKLEQEKMKLELKKKQDPKLMVSSEQKFKKTKKKNDLKKPKDLISMFIK